MPAPQPISSTTGAERPNQASVSSTGAGPPLSRACIPSSGHSRSHVACWAPESVVRRVRKLVTRGDAATWLGAEVGGCPEPKIGDIGPGRMHPSMVAHQGLSTRIVVQIDTQQLPSAGTESRRPRRPEHPLATMPAEVPTFSVGTGLVCRTRLGNREGCQIFVDALTRFAEQSRNPRLTPIIRRVAAPLRVAVRGRDGVGRGTVAAALTAAGVAVSPDESAADVDAVVIAEALKPEDRSLICAAPPADVIILNKADLSGFGAGGPLAQAHRRAADYRAMTGVPRRSDGRPARHRRPGRRIGRRAACACPRARRPDVDRRVRGIASIRCRARCDGACSTRWIGSASLTRCWRSGRAPTPPRWRRLLRRLSLLDRVVAHIDAAGAPVRYRRVRSAITELHALAAQSGDERLAEFLSTDDTVLAVMAAAVDVVEAAGVRVDSGDDPAAHLRRAVHWRRYGRGPVDALHRSCAADICRGSLRLLGRCHGEPTRSQRPTPSWRRSSRG